MGSTYLSVVLWEARSCRNARRGELPLASWMAIFHECTSAAVLPMSTTSLPSLIRALRRQPVTHPEEWGQVHCITSLVLGHAMA